MPVTIQSIKKELKANADETGIIAAQRFYKGPINTYGIKTPLVRSFAKQWFSEVSSWEKEKVFFLCDKLMQSGVIEETQIAVEWVYLLRKQFEENDFTRFEKWITNNIHHWSTCDNFCNNSMGDFLLKYPGYTSHLKKWAVADHRWLQRAAAVSLIVPARKGLFLKEGLEIAKLQLTSDDDLVQKGYGWLLKVLSKKHYAAVHTFVDRYTDRMPRTALRYAIEHFPEKTRLGLLVKK